MPKWEPFNPIPIDIGKLIEKDDTIIGYQYINSDINVVKIPCKILTFSMEKK